MRTIIAVLTGLIVLPLLAQSSLVDQGRAAITRNDGDGAVALLEKAVAQSPKNAQAHYWLGKAYALQIESAGMFSAASIGSKGKDAFEQAVALDPNLLDARYALVQIYANMPSMMGGSVDKALAQAEEIRKRDPLMGHRAAAFVHSSEKKPDLAKKEYLDEVKENPKSQRAHLDLGLFYMNSEKNFKAAGDEFDAALKIDAAYMAAFFRIGQLAALSGTNFPRGEEVLRKYLTYTPKGDDPPLARAHYWLGQIYEKQGKKAEAKASFAASLKLNPNQKDVAEALKRVS